MVMSLIPLYKLFVLLLAIIGPDVSEGSFVITEDGSQPIVAVFETLSDQIDEMYYSETTITIRDKHGPDSHIIIEMIDNALYKVTMNDNPTEIVDAAQMFMALNWDDLMYIQQAVPVSPYDAIIISSDGENLMLHGTEMRMTLEYNLYDSM